MTEEMRNQLIDVTNKTVLSVLNEIKIRTECHLDSIKKQQKESLKLLQKDNIESEKIKAFFEGVVLTLEGQLEIINQASLPFKN